MGYKKVHAGEREQSYIKTCKMVHQCDLCGKVYSSTGALRNHKTSAHDTGPDDLCAKCGKTLREEINYGDIFKQFTGSVKCICEHFVHRQDNLARHIRSQNPEIMTGSDDDGPSRKRRAIADSDTPEPSQDPSSS